MKTKKKSIRRLIYGVFGITIIAVLIITHPWSRSDNKPAIRTVKIKRGTVTASVSATGILQPLTTVEVKSNVGGQIVELAVDEGDVVQAGQLIARIDPTDTVTAYEQSQADLDAATSRVTQAREQLTMQSTQISAQIEASKQSLAASKARLSQAEEQAKLQPKLTSASISQAQSSLKSAEASLTQTKNALIPQSLTSAQSAYDQAKASYDNAQRDLNRQKELLSKGYVAKSVVDTSEEKYNVAKAQLDSAQKKLDTVKDQTNQDLITAEARVEQAKAELDNAKANSVQDKLKQQELLAARAAVKQAEASLKSALASAREESIRQGDIIQAQAQVKRSEAALRSTRTQLGYTTIAAPRAGVVTKKYVEEGSIVTAGRSSFSGTGAGVTIVDIADVGHMFVLVSVDEADIAQIKTGQVVDVIVEAYPDDTFTGTVTKIAPQSVTEQNVTTIPVTVEVDRSDQRLKPGMNATCDFITGRAENVLLVPNEAITESDKGSMVSVLENGNQIIRMVKTGIVGEDQTEIKGGLKQGVEVVIASNQTIRNNRPPGMGRPGGMPGPGGGLRPGGR